MPWSRVRIEARLLRENTAYRLQSFFRRWIRKAVFLALTDVELMQACLDVSSSVAFARQHLADVPEFKSRDQLYRWAVAHVDNGVGLWLEFGVFKGDSINRLAALRPDVTFHGFDSFVGLPEGWTIGAKKGAFDVDGQLPPVRDNVVLIPGLFEETLGAFLARHPDAPVRLLHVDCDLYSATRTVLDALSDRLHPGAVLLFDELFNYPGWQEHEYKAFTEFLTRRGAAVQYLGYVRNGAQVAVKIR